MFNASPVFELAKIVAGEIRQDLTPQPYHVFCDVNQNGNPSAFLSGFLYVGYITAGPNVFVSLKYASIVCYPLPALVSIFDTAQAEAPFLFTGYRIPLTY